MLGVGPQAALNIPAIAAARRVLREVRDFGRDGERRGPRAKVWAQLDSEAQDARQWLGRLSAGCFATHQVMERCDFSCTACYLPAIANQTPPLPFEDVKAQLDAIRAYAGPGSNVQITAGEVTLLPVDELSRIVRYAEEELGLDTMVMTHGQTFLDDPEYLYRLVTFGKADKFAIHIDTTQRGRQSELGGKREKDLSERDLMPIRDRFAALIRDMRARTGVHIHCAHTVTVTDENFEEVPDIMRWMLQNNDAMRMISFQPTADVGRTRIGEHTGGSAELWAKIAEGMGRERVNPSTFTMGDPRCNGMNLSFVVRFDDETHVMEVVREDEALDGRFWSELMSGAFTGFYADGADAAELAGRVLGMFGRSPKYLWQWPTYSARRLWEERPWLGRFMRAALAGRKVSVKPLIVVVHSFMSAAELETPAGQERLKNCGFRVPVDGEMVTMCELNGTSLRERKNLEAQRREPARLIGLDTLSRGARPAHEVARANDAPVPAARGKGDTHGSP